MLDLTCGGGSLLLIPLWWSESRLTWNAANVGGANHIGFHPMITVTQASCGFIGVDG